MSSIYLETSFVSLSVTERAEASDVYRKSVSLEWWGQQSSKHELFISAEVISELSHPNHAHKQEALKFIESVPLLAITEEVEGFAEILIHEKVMPEPVAGDAIHVSAATIYGMDYILTWNVRHLANPNKLEHLHIICRRSGLIAPTIITPEFLWEDENG